MKNKKNEILALAKKPSAGVFAVLAATSTIAASVQPIFGASLNNAINTLSGTVNGAFSSLLSFATALAGAAMLVCLIAILWCIITGDSKSIPGWKKGLFATVAVVVVANAIKWIIQIATDFGQTLVP